MLKRASFWGIFAAAIELFSLGSCCMGVSFFCVIILSCASQIFAIDYPLSCGGFPRGHVLGVVLQLFEWCFIWVNVSWREGFFC